MTYSPKPKQPQQYNNKRGQAEKNKKQWARGRRGWACERRKKERRHLVADAVFPGVLGNRLFKPIEAEADGPLRPFCLVLQAVLAQHPQILHGLRVARNYVDQRANLTAPGAEKEAQPGIVQRQTERGNV